MSYINCQQCGCNCNQCDLNQSNKTIVVPVSGASAYETWLAYHPELDPANDPTSPWTEGFWVNNYGSVVQIGDTLSRPVSPLEGKQYFDTTVNKVIYFISNQWRDSQGVIV